MSNPYASYTPPAGGGGLFLKVEDGKTLKLRLASEPYVFQSVYGEGENATVSTKYAWAVWNYEEQKAQILQLPVTGFRTIQALATDEDWGDPVGYDIKVSREGTGKETKYHINPSPNRAALDPEAKEAIAKVDVAKAIKGGAIPLSQVIAGKEVPAPTVPTPGNVDTLGADGGSDLPPVDSYDDSQVNLDDIPF